MESIKSIETFENIINSNERSIIKFEANWCPDCRRLNMFIDNIVKEHQDLQWYQIDRDDFPEIAQTYEVMGIPSLLIFRNGEKLAHLHSADAKTPEEVRQFLDSVKSKN